MIVGVGHRLHLMHKRRNRADYQIIDFGPPEIGAVARTSEHQCVQYNTLHSVALRTKGKTVAFLCRTGICIYALKSTAARNLRVKRSIQHKRQPEQTFRESFLGSLSMLMSRRPQFD